MSCDHGFVGGCDRDHEEAEEDYLSRIATALERIADALEGGKQAPPTRPNPTEPSFF